MEPLIQSGIEIAYHNIKRTVGVIITLLVIAGIGWSIYAGIIRPTTKPNATTRQEGTRDNFVYTVTPKSYFGCQNFQIRGQSEKIPRVNQGNVSSL
jgi:hypothetical protein